MGQSIITRANEAFQDHSYIWDALGALPTNMEARREIFQELKSPTPDGIERRKRLRDAITQTSHEFHGLGVEMGQRYQGRGIYDADEPEAYSPPGRAAENDILYYEPSTYPGCRLPHIWLNTTVPSMPVSTIDLVGQGQFVLLTGIGGDFWGNAAEHAQAQLGVPVKLYSIGFRKQWEDFYFDWQRICGVDDSGAVLVRPDRFVAWRAKRVADNVTSCSEKLIAVMKSIIGFSESEE